MPSTADLDNIQLQAYDVFWDNNDLGFTTVDSLVVNFAEGLINVDNADQLEGIIKQFSKGTTFSITASLKRADFDFIQTLYSDRVVEVANGADKYVSFRNKIVDNRTIAKVLRLHPSALADTDFSKDLYFPLTTATFEAFALSGSRDTPQEIAVTFQAYPDLDNNDETARLGNWTTSQGVPTNVWITTGDKLFTPSMHIAATDNEIGEIQQVQAWSSFTTNGATLALNDAGGATATDTSLPFDTLSSANAISVGDYLLLDNSTDTEVVYVSDVTYTTSTTGTLTVVRKVWGSNNNVGIVLADNDVITQYATVNIVRSTQSATWASSVAGNVTVGDTVLGTGTTGKGVYTHGGSAGASNITATDNTTASADLVVTSQ